jgi:hypothetical protein
MHLLDNFINIPDEVKMQPEIQFIKLSRSLLHYHIHNAHKTQITFNVSVTNVKF